MAGLPSAGGEVRSRVCCMKMILSEPLDCGIDLDQGTQNP